MSTIWKRYEESISMIRKHCLIFRDLQHKNYFAFCFLGHLEASNQNFIYQSNICQLNPTTYKIIRHWFRIPLKRYFTLESLELDQKHSAPSHTIHMNNVTLFYISGILSIMRKMHYLPHYYSIFSLIEWRLLPGPYITKLYQHCNQMQKQIYPLY